MKNYGCSLALTGRQWPAFSLLASILIILLLTACQPNYNFDPKVNPNMRCPTAINMTSDVEAEFMKYPPNSPMGLFYKAHKNQQRALDNYYVPYLPVSNDNYSRGHSFTNPAPHLPK